MNRFSCYAFIDQNLGDNRFRCTLAAPAPAGSFRRRPDAPAVVAALDLSSGRGGRFPLRVGQVVRVVLAEGGGYVFGHSPLGDRAGLRARPA